MEDNRERNRRIYLERLSGKNSKELAEKYDITEKRISSICKRVEEKETMQSTDLYKMIQSLYKEEAFATRTYNVLRRMGAETEEAILKLDRKTLLRTRNCGERMTELVLQMQELIRNKAD